MCQNKSVLVILKNLSFSVSSSQFLVSDGFQYFSLRSGSVWLKKEHHDYHWPRKIIDPLNLENSWPIQKLAMITSVWQTPCHEMLSFHDFMNSPPWCKLCMCNLIFHWVKQTNNSTTRVYVMIEFSSRGVQTMFLAYIGGLFWIQSENEHESTSHKKNLNI